MFCRNCGSNIPEEVKFCPKCGTMVATVLEGESGEEQENLQPSRKKGFVPIVLGTVVFVLVAAALGVGIYGTVKKQEFQKELVQWQETLGKFPSLGKYKSECNELLDTSEEALLGFRFWKYDELVALMQDTAEEIEEMNAAVEVYRTKYDEVVTEIEADSKFIMDEYEENYLNVKKELEDALAEFDESASKRAAKDFSDIRDEIVTGNAQKAKKYLDEVDAYKSDFSGYQLHPFEEYMLGDLANKLEEDRANLDYIGLQEDYTDFKVWADKFKDALSSSNRVENFVQADVSGKDRVKLYINPMDYEKYNFTLENFIIYEGYDNLWNACEPEGISQIEGMLSMDIVADISGSMRYEFYDMQCAIEGFIEQTHSDTKLGLSTIGSIYERYQEFTTDKSDIKDSLWSLECYGLTSLYQSLYSSVIYTASEEGARCVVAFTDGLNEPYGAGYDYDAQDVIDVSLYYQVPVYIIGIGSHVQSAELRNIAESTGGAYYANMTVRDLQELYTDIYKAQGRMYELSYKTATSNKTNRDIYVLYADKTKDLSVRIDSALNAEALQSAYESAGMSGDDLATFYTDAKYLSSDDLSKLGDSLEAVQTVINIYYAKNGYQFGDGENGQKQLSKMINLGVIQENGTLDGDRVTAILHESPVIWQNFSALYNYRYELIYSAALDVYKDNPGISYENLRTLVNEHYGEENQIRFNPVISSAWKNILAGK